MLGNTHVFVFGIGVKDIDPNRNRWRSYPRKNHVYNSAECYDTATGHLVTRLDRPGHVLEDCHLSPDGRWLVMIEGHSVVRIISAAGGAEVASTPAPGWRHLRSGGRQRVGSTDGHELLAARGRVAQ